MNNLLLDDVDSFMQKFANLCVLFTQLFFNVKPMILRHFTFMYRELKFCTLDFVILNYICTVVFKIIGVRFI